MGEIQSWMNFNINNTAGWSSRGGWCEFWATTWHCLWSWRNKELFEEGFVRPSRPGIVISQMVSDYEKASRLNERPDGCYDSLDSS
ncbi:hypothetical protein A2U01_0014038 [Trifolium medium]|uniref:Uncharacterized protein n=1 Tax=Trifolium medium TaxID=97028 RepID=A0A392MZW8_9FABA|nr:hypothetical protein [Trifolium medium]